MSFSEMTALIICEPGPLQEGLRDLLATLPQVNLIDAVWNSDEAIKIVTTQHPALILIDTHLSTQQETHRLLSDIKSCEPSALCIVVAGDVEQEKTAIAAGADSVQLTGYPADELFDTIQRLLNLRASQS